MSIFRKNHQINAIYKNNKSISKIYKGQQLVYSNNNKHEYLTFTAITPSTIKYNGSTKEWAKYSYDKENWQEANGVLLRLNENDKVYFKGRINDNKDSSSYATFTITGEVNASGSIQSLVDENPNSNYVPPYAFYRLFYYCSSLISAPELPATILSDYCYNSMFHTCTQLKVAPKLPAKTLANYCYAYMFYGCSSFKDAPELNSMELADGCYSSMFGSCIQLINAPKLPATNLAKYCYSSMFQGCTSLINAPELPATQLVDSCYYYMFMSCINLMYIKALFINKTPNTTGWVSYIKTRGKFVMNKDATFTPSQFRGENGIPQTWTVETE